MKNYFAIVAALILTVINSVAQPAGYKAGSWMSDWTANTGYAATDAPSFLIQSGVGALVPTNTVAYPNSGNIPGNAATATTASNASGTGSAVITNDTRQLDIGDGNSTFEGNALTADSAALATTAGTASIANSPNVLQTSPIWLAGIDLGGNFSAPVVLDTNAFRIYSSGFPTGNKTNTIGLNPAVTNGFQPLNSELTKLAILNAIDQTNLSTTNLVGTLPDARLSPNVPLMQSGIITNPVSSSSLPANAVTNNQSFVKGGNVLTLDLQASGASLNGQLQGAFGGKPWKFIYGGTPVVIAGRLLGETNIMKIVNEIKTNGIYTALTNDGSTVAIYVDAGALSGIRNTNWPYVETNHGTMQADSRWFPHGIGWLKAFLTTNGIKLAMQMNSGTNILPTGATSWTSDLGGGAPVLYTNGVSTLISNADGNYSVYIGPDTLEMDASELTWWGVDLVTVEMSTQQSDFRQLSYAWGRALLYSVLPAGWGQTNYPVNFQTQDVTLFDVTQTNQFVAKRIPTQQLIGKNTPVGMISYQTIFDGSTNVANYGNLTAQNGTGYFYDNTDQGQGIGALRQLTRDFPGVTRSSQGAYISWLGNNGQKDSAAGAMFHGFFVTGYTNDPVIGSGWNSYLSFQTNNAFTRVSQDPLQAWPLCVADYGSNPTNGASVWVTRMVGGNMCVGFFNEATNAQNVTVTWAQLGVPTNTVFHCYSISPDLTANGTMIPSIDYGLNRQSLSLSEGANTGNNGYQLIQFDVVSSVGQNDGQQWFNNTTINGTSIYVTKGLGAPGGTGYDIIQANGQGNNGSGFNSIEAAIELGFNANSSYRAQFASRTTGVGTATKDRAYMGVLEGGVTNWGLWTDGAGHAGAEHDFSSPLYNGNGFGLTNVPSTNLFGTIPNSLLSSNVAMLNSNQTFTATNTFIQRPILTTNNLSGAFDVAWYGSDPGGNFNSVPFRMRWNGSSFELNDGNNGELIAFDANFNASDIVSGTLSDNILSANVPLLNSPTNKFTGVLMVTNAPTIVQAGRTNVNLVGATSFTVSMKTAMPSTNYVPTLTDNGAAIPGLSFVTITTTNFTTSMTALTFAGNLLWTATGMTQ